MTGHAPLSAPTRVLVVEDDPYLRATVGQLLTRDGYRVTMTANGLEGLRELRSHPVWAVVLDLSMPVMDGEEFLQEKVRDPEIAGVPTVVVTGSSPDESLRQLDCVVSVLRKPVEFGRLLRVLRELAPRSSAH